MAPVLDLAAMAPVLDLAAGSLLSVKETNILAIILVPLIMTLSRGHTGQIKGTAIMR